MDTMILEGGTRLRGEIPIHGAKNSALPLLAATLLPTGVSTVRNCPHLSDVEASLDILRHLGCRITRRRDTVTVDAAEVTACDIPDRLMREMRSSIVFLGAMIARCGRAELSYPGGCELGPRPIDLHLMALRRLGVRVEEQHGHIRCRAEDGLHGAEITLAFPSVGATENVLLAACTARGTTVLRHAAREPEIRDLCAYLNRCGAHIDTTAEGELRIEGVEGLHGCEHRVIPDRIETATYLAAAAATGGELTLRHCCPEDAAPVFPVLEEMGCAVACSGETIHIAAPARLHSPGTVRTMPFPGFPTDAAAPLLAASCVADGTAVFIESIFENRYKYVDELARMGARIRVNGRVAVAEGVPDLQGAAVECTDLRGGAALVIAGLAAEGETRLTGLRHLDRGYDDMTACLRAAGARVVRENIG